MAFSIPLFIFASVLQLVMSSASILWQVCRLCFLCGDMVCLVSKSTQLYARSCGYYLELTMLKMQCLFFQYLFWFCLKALGQSHEKYEKFNSIDVGIFNPLTEVRLAHCLCISTFRGSDTRAMDTKCICLSVFFNRSAVGMVYPL